MQLVLMDNQLAEPVYFTVSGDRRWSPYAAPLDILEQERVYQIQRELKAVWCCYECRTIIRQDNCQRCKLITQQKKS